MARPGGLGKGLGALIPAGAAEPRPAAGTPGMLEIEVAAIRPNPYQPRDQFDEEGLGALADSIREVGVLQPVLVRPVGDGYELIAGERRWRAARRAGLTHVPVVIKEATEREMLELALIENIQRADLNPLEEALAYQQMAEFSQMTREEIAERVGKSRSAVSNTMRLLQLPEPIQDLVRQALLSEGHARTLLALPSASVMMAAAELFIKQGFSVRQAEAWVKKYNNPPEKATPREPSIHDRELQRQFTSALGTRVELRRGKKGGQVVIYFENEEDLQSIYQTLLPDS